MDMCYDGALVMPSSYAMMDEEEMSYVDGGGTVGLRLNAAAVEFLCETGASAGCGAMAALMGATGVGAVFSAALGNIAYNMIMDCCGCEYSDVDLTYSAWYIPGNHVIEWNR